MNNNLPASEQDLFDHLNKLEISVTTIEHVPMFTIEDGKEALKDVPGGHCKTLFLKDKNSSLWLVIMLGNARVDMKKLQQKIGAARLSFAKPALMSQVLGVSPGSVTPFALINKTAKDVNVVLEAKMMEEELLNYHPLRNDATTSITSSDLLKFIHAVGHEPIFVDI